MTEFRQPRGDVFHDVIGAVAEDEHDAVAAMRAQEREPVPPTRRISPNHEMFDKIFRERRRYCL